VRPRGRLGPAREILGAGPPLGYGSLISRAEAILPFPQIYSGNESTPWASTPLPPFASICPEMRLDCASLLFNVALLAGAEILGSLRIERQDGHQPALAAISGGVGLNRCSAGCVASISSPGRSPCGVRSSGALALSAAS